MARDPYEVLGVRRGATPEEVKAAYRRQAMEHHPDRNPHDPHGSAERFRSARDAYDRISRGDTAAHAGTSQRGGGFADLQQRAQRATTMAKHYDTPDAHMEAARAQRAADAHYKARYGQSASSEHELNAEWHEARARAVSSERAAEARRATQRDGGTQMAGNTTRNILNLVRANGRMHERLFDTPEGNEAVNRAIRRGALHRTRDGHLVPGDGTYRDESPTPVRGQATDHSEAASEASDRARAASRRARETNSHTDLEAAATAHREAAEAHRRAGDRETAAEHNDSARRLSQDASHMKRAMSSTGRGAATPRGGISTTAAFSALNRKHAAERAARDTTSAHAQEAQRLSSIANEETHAANYDTKTQGHASSQQHAAAAHAHRNAAEAHRRAGNEAKALHHERASQKHMAQFSGAAARVGSGEPWHPDRVAPVPRHSSSHAADQASANAKNIKGHHEARKAHALAAKHATDPHVRAHHERKAAEHKEHFDRAQAANRQAKGRAPEAPHALKKGKKGGTYYISDTGHKVYTHR